MSSTSRTMLALVRDAYTMRKKFISVFCSRKFHKTCFLYSFTSYSCCAYRLYTSSPATHLLLKYISNHVLLLRVTSNSYNKTFDATRFRLHHFQLRPQPLFTTTNPPSQNVYFYLSRKHFHPPTTPA